MRWTGTILAVVAVVGLAACLTFFNTPKKTTLVGLQTASSTTDAVLTKSYASAKYQFSLMMPGDYFAQESDDAQTGTKSVVLQNQTGDGIQILVSPFDEDAGSYILTKERILKDIPTLAISDEQPIQIGTAYQGLAFKSNSAAFGGDSREVWFVFHGNLYQISTYERLDPLLRAIFKTWQFN